MKVETLTVFVCSVFCATCVTSFVMSGENVKIEFKVSSYEKCLEDGKANVLLRDISLNQCVLDCTERSECVAVNYRRNYLHCEQFASEDGNFVQNSRKTGQCMFVRMTDVIVTLHEKPQTFCRCQEGKTCGTESGFCVNTVCAKLTIGNGTLNGDMTEVGARVTYTCDASFVEKDGQPSSTCLSNGFWTHEPECIKGGQTSSTCLSNGLWTHEPECIKVCERLEVENGTLNENNREVGAVVTYTCNAGFVEKDGQTSSTCQSNGLWTHEPTCIKVCERLMIENGTLIDDDRKVGAVVNYTCNAGFNEKDGQTSTTCQSNGLWTHEPKCVKVCERLMIENGTLIDDDRKVGAVVNYTCNAGFNEKDGQTSSTCQSNGLWTHEPKCVKVCERLMIENGTLINDDRKVGAVVTYTCNAGFNEKDGQTSTTCQSNGLWTHEPKCVKDCNEPAIHPNSSISKGPTTEGTTRVYSCHDFFRLSVDSNTERTTCGNDGTWSATDFRCVLDYKYVGCHTTYLTMNDSTLRVLFTDIVNITPELCVSYCFSHGNIYAAVRNELCTCGTHFSIYGNAIEANCDQRCPGDRNLTCGGSWTFSVFKKSDDENYLGCYIDINPDRILNGAHDLQMAQMTTNTCLEICRKHEMKYAYTEFSNECFCGNELQNAEKVADNECSMPCSGNDAEFCGNNLRASLYTTD